jgi:hypothetical protein
METKNLHRARRGSLMRRKIRRRQRLWRDKPVRLPDQGLQYVKERGLESPVGTVTQVFRLPLFCVYSKKKLSPFFGAQESGGGEWRRGAGNRTDQGMKAGAEEGEQTAREILAVRVARDFQTESGAAGAELCNSMV